jgi:hypothetical protein
VGDQQDFEGNASYLSGTGRGVKLGERNKEMSDLQDQLDRGEITLDEYHERWVAEMEENERLHPGIHDRSVRAFDGQVPRSPGVDAGDFFALDQ